MLNTREEWLNAFIKAAGPAFEEANASLPEKVRASIGFTSHGARGKRIGECWSDSNSGDGTFEIFIVPGQDDAHRIAGILTHELVHAAVGLECGHRGRFRTVAVALGLTGKMTATEEGENWHGWADPIIERIGPLPHAKLQGAPSVKKQSTRMIKCECDTCGFVFRAATKWALDASEELRCPDPSCEGDVLPS